MRMAEKVRNNYQTSDILHKTVAKWLYWTNVKSPVVVLWRTPKKPKAWLGWKLNIFHIPPIRLSAPPRAWSRGNHWKHWSCAMCVSTSTYCQLPPLHAPGNRVEARCSYDNMHYSNLLLPSWGRGGIVALSNSSISPHLFHRCAQVRKVGVSGNGNRMGMGKVRGDPVHIGGNWFVETRID